ncbi:MAG: sigma-70 family RNA polymerase sigma factor [Polyangiaceae bacterium]|nr:sigma-70 family RNA polymerase sigma factor [Polyangiaceae bacterium]
MCKARVTRALLERAIAREPQAVREFVAVLEPIFRVRIGRVLLRAGDASRRDIEDLCQDTFVSLLRDGGRLARSWDPTRGSFENFSALIAKQRAIEELRKRREELLHDDGQCDVSEPALDSSRMPERIAASREMLRKVFDILRAELSEHGSRLFQLLFVEDREVTEVCALMNMQKDAVYAWRSRLGRRIEEIAATMGGAE